MTVFAPTEVRASEIARGCDRMSVLRAMGTEARDFDPEQLEWFARGSLFEEYVVRQLVAKHGKENVQRQVNIEHPLGVGHADALIVPDRVLVEIKSTTAGSLSTPVFENGVNQLRFYLRFCDQADVGALYMINPNTLRPADVYTVTLDEEQTEEIDETVRRIERHIELNVLPDRACSKPSDGRGYFCPFVETCFQGWEAPEPGEVSEPAALDAASRLYAIAQTEREHKQAIQALEDDKRAATAALRYFMPPRGDTIVGGFRVKTWPVDGATTVSAKALSAAGIDPAPFAKKGDGRISVKVTKSDTPGDIDYGDNPL